MSAPHQTGPEYTDARRAALQAALRLIVERARSSTGAAGAAISLGDCQGMVCRASTGAAPDIGAPLRPDAGLSGSCLRTADMVLCADARSDPRVDASAAQRLGLGSMVVLPVFAFGRLAGVLQVLSPRPNAFDNAKVLCLAQYAQVLTAALEHRLDLSKFAAAANVNAQSGVAPPQTPVSTQEQPASAPPTVATEQSQSRAPSSASAAPKSPAVPAPPTRNEPASAAGTLPTTTKPSPGVPISRAKAGTRRLPDFGSRMVLYAAVVGMVAVLLAAGGYALRRRADRSGIANPAAATIPISTTTRAEAATPSTALETGSPDSARLAAEAAMPAAPLESRATTASKAPIPEAAGKLGAGRSSGRVATLQALANKMRQVKVTDLAAIEQRAASGDPEARVVLGLAYTQGSLLKKDPAKAIAWYRKAAEQAYAPAEEALGFAYLLGSGVPKDGAQSVHWYARAAEHGSVVAANELGAMYTSGDAVAQNFAEAVKWYRAAADRGDATGEYNLARMYHLGQGVAASPGLEFQYLLKAADQGFPAAQYNLALMYQEGKAVTANPREAVRLLREAAARGYTMAQTNLGYVYMKGLGVPVDYGQSLKWYRMAAEQGEPMAAYAVSVRYLSGGHGISQDYGEAAKWSRVAAEIGHPDAQYNLALLYASGKGVTKDLVAAYKWFALCGEPGSNEEMRSLQKEMTPAQLSDAQRAVEQWRSTHQKP